jgi:hypothetical protein
VGHLPDYRALSQLAVAGRGSTRIQELAAALDLAASDPALAAPVKALRTSPPPPPSRIG